MIRALPRQRNMVIASNQPDKVFSQLSWTVIGDRARNWLFVVCSNPKRDVRYAAVTAYPGGWPIRSQWAGMDGETRQVMHRLCKRLFRKHQGELI